MSCQLHQRDGEKASGGRKRGEGDREGREIERGGRSSEEGEREGKLDDLHLGPHSVQLLKGLGKDIKTRSH